jgi:serine/threonine-protein kinase
MASILTVAGEDVVDGTPFGRYRLVELLGRGGMGEVWRAHDTDTDRIVAIKLLPAHLSTDADFQRRFRREAHAAARLNNPHIIPIHHYGEIDGRLYVDMRLIEGRDLQTVLADGPLEPGRAVRIIDQVAKALHAAHRVGLLHRDIKPSNILLDGDDFAYLIDFGIARAADETRMTKSGNTIGTFAYIAPERLDPQTVEDARTDVYSLACVLYESLTGKPPFAGTTTAHLIAAHLNTPPPRPSTTRPDVPPAMDVVIATGMAKDPGSRYPTTVELANAARDAITEPIARPIPSPPTVPATEQAPLPPTQWEGHRVPAWPTTVQAEWPPPAKPAPPQPIWPTPARAGGISRRTTIAIIVGVVGVFAIAATVVAVGVIPALGKHQPSVSSPTSSARSPTSSVRSYTAEMVLPLTGLNEPIGVAVDATGTLYVTDTNNNRVLKLAAGSSTPTELPFTALNHPDAVAVDSAGTVYVTDTKNQRVLKLAAGSSTPSELPFTGLDGAVGVAVDSAGTLYIADGAKSRVFKLAVGSSTPNEMPFTGLNMPAGVAVDSAGTLYVTDGKNNRVLKLAAGSSTPTELPFTGLNMPAGVAVDSAGTVYITDFSNKRVLKLAAGSSTPTELPFTGLQGCAGVATDSAGNVYVTDGVTNRVLKLPVQ